MPFGVYVHIPFCARRCDYCAFATWTDRGSLFDAYVQACRREVVEAELPPASSVFFGGGTPSLLPADLLCSILGVISRRGDAEVTVECNPESVSAPLLGAYRAAGVTRLSFGAQSTAPHVLASLGRSHRPGDLAAAVAAARAAGFTTFNVDLDQSPMLKGLPNDECQCPHWGYVVKGSMTMRSGDREEVLKAGDAYYLAPGHVGISNEPGTELVQFSPADELSKTSEVIMKNMQASQGG